MDTIIFSGPPNVTVSQTYQFSDNTVNAQGTLNTGVPGGFDVPSTGGPWGQVTFSFDTPVDSVQLLITEWHDTLPVSALYFDINGEPFANNNTSYNGNFVGVNFTDNTYFYDVYYLWGTGISSVRVDGPENDQYRGDGINWWGWAVTQLSIGEPLVELFSSGNDIVDFNTGELSDTQISEINSHADLYHSLAGNDSIVLPNVANYQLTSSVLWDSTQTFFVGDGNDKIMGGDGTDWIALGDGTDVIYGSPGDDSIFGGTGQDTFDYQAADYHQFSYQEFGDFNGFAPGTQQTIVGGHLTFQDAQSAQQNLLKLPGSLDDYNYSVQVLQNDFSKVSVIFSTKDSSDLPSGIIIDTTGIEKVEFAEGLSTSTPNVHLTDNSIAAEALALANESYGYSVEVRPFHTADPLSYEQPNSSNPITNDSSTAAVNRGWFAIQAIDLGIGAADFGQQGTLHYSFVNGYFQAYDTSDTKTSSGDYAEADALVLIGNVNGVKTLSISFSGTDQIADYFDYFTFATYYAKYAPLIQALKTYVTDNNIFQILVAGHSLGAGALQYFTKDFSSTKVQIIAYTAGSPGAENDTIIPSLPGDAVTSTAIETVNFVHTDDLVPKLGELSVLAKPLAIQAFASLLIDSGYQNAYTVAGVLYSMEAKTRVGETVYIDSDVTANPYSTAEHKIGLYQRDLDKLLFYASDSETASPFHAIALAIQNNTIDSILKSEYGGSIQVAVGKPSDYNPATGESSAPYSNEIYGYANDQFVLGNATAGETFTLQGKDLHATAHGPYGLLFRVFDSGLAASGKGGAILNITTLEEELDKSEVSFVQNADGSVTLYDQSPGYLNSPALIGTLYGFSFVKLHDGLYYVDGQKANVQYGPQLSGVGSSSNAALSPLNSAASITPSDTASSVQTLYVDSSYDYTDAGDGNFAVVGTAGNDIIFIGKGNKTITGGGGQDLITINDDVVDHVDVDGGTGAVVITGGIGIENYYVGNVDAQIIVNQNIGQHTIFTSVDYTAPDNVDKLYLNASGLTGVDGNTNGTVHDLYAYDTVGATSTLIGVANGLDVLWSGQKSIDSLQGQGGYDAFIVFNSADTVSQAFGGNGHIVAFADFALPDNVDNIYLEAPGLTATDSNQDGNLHYLYAFDAPGSSSTLIGGSNGNDVLFSGHNSIDNLQGQGGYDAFIIFNSADAVSQISGGNGHVLTFADFVLPDNVDNIYLGASGLTASDGNQDGHLHYMYAYDAPGASSTLVGGSAGADIMFSGHNSVDHFVGQGGYDAFVVFNSADVVSQVAGGDGFVAAFADFALPDNIGTLYLSVADLTGTANSAGSKLYAFDGAGSHSTLIGSTGNDTLFSGHNSIDSLAGNGGFDAFVVYNSADTVTQAAGGDGFISAFADYVLPENVSAIYLQGSASHATGNNDAVNYLYGNASVASTLTAGTATTGLFVNGTAGTTMIGGSGTDSFVFPAAFGHDQIQNFQVDGASHDYILLDHTVFADFNAVTLNMADDINGNAVITHGADTITISGVSTAILSQHQQDFLFV